MNREELRTASASRRTHADAPKATVIWKCAHCVREYQTEQGFMKHHCLDREKFDLVRSPVGQAAYSYYAEWMKLKKRTVPPIETFMTSRQFNYFVKFVEWADKTSIPDPKQFIKLMVESDTQPLLWCRSTTYALYLQLYDRTYPPEQQFVQTLDKLIALAEDMGVPISHVYDALGPSTLTTLIRRRKISPWLLVVSPNFLKWIQRIDDKDRSMVSDAIDFSVYVDKMKARPELAHEFRKACESEDV